MLKRKRTISKNFTKKEIFTGPQLKALIIPLLIDQVLNVLVGMIDTVMISKVGESAVSGVSLVDTLNMFFLMIFSGLATGGVIVCAQFIGMNKEDEAKKAGNQLILTTTFIALIFFVFSFYFRVALLHLIFGDVEAAVMENALAYFVFISISLPFLAIYNCGAALFRSIGNSKTPMKISLIMNVINIAGNALCLYVFHMGVVGVAIPTLVSRIIAAILSFMMLRNKSLTVSMHNFTFKPNFIIIKRILKLAIPSSLESGIFQIGKILVLGLVSSLGTVAITANAVANSILTFQSLTEDAMGIGMVTVVGQCEGYKDDKQTSYYIRLMMKYTYFMMWLVNIPMLIISNQIIGLYNLSVVTFEVTKKIMIYNALCALTIWPVSFTLPNAIRARGHVVYTMGISLFSMWFFRIGLSYLLVKVFEVGLVGIYFSFGIDWVFRSVAFFAHDKFYNRNRIIYS